MKYGGLPMLWPFKSIRSGAPFHASIRSLQLIRGITSSTSPVLQLLLRSRIHYNIELPSSKVNQILSSNCLTGSFTLGGVGACLQHRTCQEPGLSLQQCPLVLN